jgi:hypothetical protein
MKIVQSIVAVIGGLLAGVALDQWIVFPAILAASAYLPPGAFVEHKLAFEALILLLGLGSATLCTGVIVGLVAPARPAWHALAAGLVGGISGLALGPAGSVTTLWRVVAYSVQTIALVAIATRVAAWRAHRRRISMATA